MPRQITVYAVSDMTGETVDTSKPVQAKNNLILSEVHKVKTTSAVRATKATKAADAAES